MKKLVVVVAIAFAVLGGIIPAAYADPPGCGNCYAPSSDEVRP